MRSTLALSLAFTASSALASPLLDIRDSRGISNTTGLPASFNQTTGASNATALNCTSFVKTFELTSNNTLLAIPIPTGAKAVSDLVTDFVSVNTNFTEEYLVGSNETTGSYDIWMQYCEPASGATKNATLELIHGINFDHSYWSFNTSSNGTEYNFIQAAANAGYATLAYDRLGVAQSSKPNGINVTQTATEVAIANAVAEALRNGTLVPGNSVQPAEQVVAIGHSYGSAQSHGLATMHPDAVDAVVLTGFSTNGQGVPLFLSASTYSPASEVNATRFGNYSNEYLLSGTVQGDRQLFFYNGGYDEEVFVKGEAARQTVTIGELLTLGGPIAPPQAASNFTGDVLVVTGSHDLVYCAGGCIRNGTNLPAEVQTLYPNAGSFETYIPAYTGHAINLHYSAPETYAYVFEWLSQHGL